MEVCTSEKRFNKNCKQHVKQHVEIKIAKRYAHLLARHIRQTGFEYNVVTICGENEHPHSKFCTNQLQVMVVIQENVSSFIVF